MTQRELGDPLVGRRWFLTGSIGGLVGLAGCGLPGNRSIEPGLAVGLPASDEVTIVPPGPAVDANPVQIVRGFLRAGSANDDDSAVARSFLAPSEATHWNPDAATWVFDTVRSLRTTPVAGARDRVRLQVTLSARLNSEGQYEAIAVGEQQQATFAMEQVNGQWRISSLPSSFGRCLSQAQATRLFQRYSLYWLSVAESLLVPDPRWFAPYRLPTRLAQALLAGPPSYLKDAVYPAAGTGLSKGAVIVDNGKATVDIGRRGGVASSSAVRVLSGQLAATLTQIPDVSAVQVTIEGTPVQLPGVSLPVTSPQSLGMTDVTLPANPAVLLRHEGGWRWAGPAGPGGSPGPAARFPLLAPDFTVFALSSDSADLAAVTRDGKRFARSHADGRAAVSSSFATELTRPAFDRFGMVWVAGRGRQDQTGAKLWAMHQEDDAALVPAGVPGPWFTPGLQILAARPSPEGTRLAFIVRESSRAKPVAVVTGVVRGKDDRPTSLARQALSVSSQVTDVRDLCWVSPTALAVIGRLRPRAALAVMFVDVGGGVTTLEPLDSPAAITTVDGQRGVVVTDARQRLTMRAGRGWFNLPYGTDLLVAGG